MKNYLDVAKQLYPADNEDYPWISDYQPIINHFGTIAVQVDDDNYEGDSRILYADTGKGIGYLNFGWGSCSGCDSLQACCDYNDVAELIKSLESEIRWEPKDAMLKFFKEHDWQGDYSWCEEGQKQFLEQAILYLESI